MDILREGLSHASKRISGSKGGSDIPKPRDDDELWHAVRRYWGVEIPRVKVCEHHVAPFTAFADAYFARHPFIIWKASRGFGGKSMLLSLLSLSEAAFLGAFVNLLGGSGEQAERVLAYMYGDEMPGAFWGAPGAPKHLIIGGDEDGLLKRETKLNNKGRIRALMASSKSVRGPHPQRLRLDEVDEMDIKILDSAMGQPMERFGIKDNIVGSSTHHYSNGTMTEMIRRASTNNWPVYEWCYRENLVSNGGWLPDDAVARKRSVVTVHMWDTEYENQEPNPTGRAIDIDKCTAAFDEELGKFEGSEHEYIELEPPDYGGLPEPTCHRCKHEYEPMDYKLDRCQNCFVQRRLTRPAIYATGADWAKKKDWTVITTIRVDCTPARVVAFERTGRIDWPAMIDKLNVRLRRFRGGSCHDMTGIGDVIGDYLQVASEGVIMMGYTKQQMVAQYVHAIEAGRLKYPRIKYAYDEHRLASVEDFYGGGQKFHLPDTAAAGALAWMASGMGGAGEIMIPGKNVMLGTPEERTKAKSEDKIV